MKIITSLVSFLIYPIWFPLHFIHKKKRSAGATFLAVIFSLLVLMPIWIGGYTIFFIVSWYGLQYMGVATVEIPVTGASMLPTIKEQGYVPVRHYPHLSQIPELRKYYPVEQFEPTIKKGDIIVFRNTKTQEVFAQEQLDPHKKGGFVKRVLGTEGDTVTIRNGFVYVNGKIIKEPYILKPRSTFGGNAMHDCDMVQVPKDKYLVLGDNRKVSLDSRQIGLVDKKDVEFYLPYQDQLSTYSSRWRDTRNDEVSSFASELDVQEYIRLLNEKRQKFSIKPLRYEPKLAKSAELRAQKMLQYDDLSFEATRSGYTMRQAMADASYSNIVYGEFPVLGYYEAQELIDSFFENPDATNFLLQKDYQDIGVSSFVGSLNGCPVQIVVQHFAGYVPPNYTNKDIDEWKALVDKLTEIRDGWLDLRNKGDFYDDNKADVDRINEIIRLRASHARQLIRRMEANEWFTPEEKNFIEEDKKLFEEQNAIADRLNKKLRGE